MEDIVKIVQICFYVTASIVAVLTFIKAKNGLLNSVNTEYQKRVMDRLASLSDELWSEFDNDSPNYWIKTDSVKEVLDRIHKDALPHKHEIITNSLEIPGIPVPEMVVNLEANISRIKSDPFIPTKIRQKVIDLLLRRVSAMSEVFHVEIKKYQQDLTEGKHWETIDTNHHWLHNKINEGLYERGCGISHIEESAHELRLEIQKYFEQFNPIKS